MYSPLVSELSHEKTNKAPKLVSTFEQTLYLPKGSILGEILRVVWIYFLQIRLSRETH